MQDSVSALTSWFILRIVLADIMTAIAEIESAIERLSPAEVKELAAWLEEYQQMVNASAEIFSMYDKEEEAGS